MNQLIDLNDSSISLFIKREDLLHPYISGNKFRKLKFNILEAKRNNKDTLLTFGGAFSNHILAVAAAGKENNFKTIGVIRGDELASKINQNPTLKKAQEFGMIFEFVSREIYRNKENDSFHFDLKNKYGDFYLIPEGGTNEFAVRGCEEILTSDDDSFDFICCSVGTGGTISGIINCSKPCQKVLGFPALKGDFLQEDIRKFANGNNWEIISDYHFGGYAKVNNELVDFINDFNEKYKVPLDPIYTGKMVYGVLDLIKNDFFPKNSKILLIHTGGLQGIKGMNLILKNKKLTQINYEVQ
ncbi:1-aminocyclopropane-1-carboxylate deaminase/D-cysteine desulfhydrase [Flavobacterium capsici]|uniref:1-aminocyclopropane-1-carboxylate deaminase/D-cysteine desulfhydrase n=1 Tax=Flavobacterium capsici TaxID=3075618 RepID=UPI00374F44E8